MQGDILISLTNMPHGDERRHRNYQKLALDQVPYWGGKAKVGVKQQKKKKKKMSKQREPSGALGRGKGPNSPPQTPARLPSLACPLAFSPTTEPVTTFTVQRNMSQWDTPHVLQSHMYALWLQTMRPSRIPVIGTCRSDDGATPRLQRENA